MASFKSPYSDLNTVSRSHVLDSVLSYIYRKNIECGRYGQRIIEKLQELNLVVMRSTKKGVFYFKTDKSKDFKAKDFALAYLWNYHNESHRKEVDGKKFILCFDSSLEDGSDMIEINEALKKCFV